MAGRFLRYLQQMRELYVKGASDNHTPGGNLFWQMIRDIYDGTSYGSLKLCIREQWKQDETIHFDHRTQTFSISYQWRLMDWRNDLLINPFKFLNLHYIRIDDNVSTLDRETGGYKIHTMSEILNAVLLNERVSLYIGTPEKELALCNMIHRENILGHTSYRLITFPDKHRSIVQHAYFHAGALENNVLEKVSAIYPSIQKFTLSMCTPPMESVDSYTIDLGRFKNVQELMFDCDMILGLQRRRQTLCIHTTYDDRYYYYKDNDKHQVVHAVKNAKKVPKYAHIVNIKCNALKKFDFRRKDNKLEIK
jgi:hypothetical protein